jgi:hypothetical protein
MAQATSAPANRANQKQPWYKAVGAKTWVVGVAVPIVVALIALIPRFTSPTPTASSPIFITDITVIENQYQQATGQPLTDPALKQLIEQGIRLAKAGDVEPSRRIFEQLANSVPVPAVYNNLGALDAKSGNMQAAEQNFTLALAKDPNYKPAKENLSVVRSSSSSTSPPQVANGMNTRGAQPSPAPPPEPAKESVPDQNTASLQSTSALPPQTLTNKESQSGNDIAHPITASLGRQIVSAIPAAGATYFFRYQAVRGPRDRYQATIESGSPTLFPAIAFFDGNRHQLCKQDPWEAVAQVSCTFTAAPDSFFYVQAYASRDTTGNYTLLVSPLKRFDSFEPNDDFDQAKKIAFGSTISANIMDEFDSDYYAVTTSKAGPASATVKNDSTSMFPAVRVFDNNRHELCKKDPWEAVAEVQCEFTAAPNSIFYVRVYSSQNTSGSYRLTVK